MTPVDVNVFMDSLAEKNAEAMDDYQSRRVPELKDDQLGRVWTFSKERDLIAFEKLLSQWGSAGNIPPIVLSDDTGITTLGGKLFAGILYATDDDGAILSDQFPDDADYTTPAHNSTYITKDGAWSVVFSYEESVSDVSKTVDLVATVTETHSEATKEWRIVFASVAVLDEEDDVLPGTNVVLSSSASGTIYYNEVEQGDSTLYPITGTVICDVPERYNVQSIESPKIDKEPLDGTYRNSGIYRMVRRAPGSSDPDNKLWYIIQIIRRFYVEQSDYSKIGTNWEVKNGREYRSGSGNLVLQLRNLSPSVARGIAAEISSGTTEYNNVIHTTTDGLVSGKWTSIYADHAIDEDGSGVVLWFLRNHNNDDMIFRWRTNENELRALFLKVNCAVDAIEEFGSTYYFDTDANFYISSDGEDYTNKNGTEEAGVLPADAKLLSDIVASRVIYDLSSSNNKETGEVDIRVSMAWFSDADENGIIYSGRYGEVSVDISLEDVSEARRDAFVDYTYVDTSGHWYYSTDGNNYTAKDGAPASGVLPTDANKIEQQNIEGRRQRVVSSKDRSTNLWTVQVSAQFLSSDTRCSYLNIDTRLSYKTGTNDIVFDQAYNITHDELATAMAYYNTAPTYGTRRQISQPQKDAETGLYSYVAIEIASTKVAATFRIGPDTVYVGYNYPKMPTTDVDAFNADNPETLGVLPESDSYYLLGAIWVDGAWTCTIDPTSNVSGYPELDQDNNTWSWKIRHSYDDSEIVGPEDPSSDNSNSFIFQYGDILNFTRWVGRYPAQVIELGKLSLLSYFEDIPAGTFGAHPVLRNRRKVTPFIKNERKIDGLLYYDVYEQVRTPDINDNDDWYDVGCTESLDRKNRNIDSKTIYNTGAQYPGSGTNTVFTHLMTYPDAHFDHTEDKNSDNSIDVNDAMNGKTGLADVPMVAILQSAVKRRKTVRRRRKFFCRRPTTSDLQNTNADEGITLKEAMDAVANSDTNSVEPSSLSASTYDVVKVSDDIWAVERMDVVADDEFYRDNDAFDHFKDSDGNSTLGVVIQPVHMQTIISDAVSYPDITINPTVVDADTLHLR